MTYKKFKLDFSQKYNFIYKIIPIMLGIVFFYFLFVIFLYPDLYIAFVFPLLVIVLLIIMICRAIFGSVKINNSCLIINYGFAFINRKININDIISIRMVYVNEPIPRAQPAYGNIENTICILYNDPLYKKKSELFLSIQNIEDFLKLLDRDR
ncbi:MAG: hypothetical protein E7562_03880 [Ruminococcaceae bacterium]|nr:hypothetical protein [Oscillospiraceae bacterium]